MMRWLAIMPALLALAVAPTLAMAQGLPGFASRSYITPFPPSDQYALIVLGDSLAEGLTGGISTAFEKEATLRVTSAASWGVGLTRDGSNDLAAELGRRATAQPPANIAVIMAGLNDVRNLRDPAGRVARWGTPEWRDAYGKLIDAALKTARDAKVALYWVGLPAMSDAKLSEQMQTLNEIIRERTYLGGARFVDTFAGFTDQFGGYAASGADMTGQTKKLREADGVHFTAAGYRKLAHYVEVILRRDIAAAQAERNVPLAGDPDELAALVPGASAAEPAQQSPARAGKEPLAEDPNAAADPAADAGSGEDAVPAPGDVPSSEAELEEPASDLQPRAPAPAGAGYAPGGELIAGDITSGVTGLASISPANDVTQRLAGGRRPADAEAYAKAMERGEPVAAKPGRADDFAWRPAN